MKKAWDPAFLRTIPGAIAVDNRPDAPADNFYWAGDGEQAAQLIRGYASMWLPAQLLDRPERGRLVTALAQAASTWKVSLHLNKGLAGARPEVISAAREYCHQPSGA